MHDYYSAVVLKFRITFGERNTIMTQEQLNAIQAKTKKITNHQLLEIVKRLKKASDEKVNPEPEEQAKYIDALMEAKLIAPVTITDMNGETENQIKVQFSSLTNPQKERYFMVFTDIETMRKNIQDTDKILLIAVTYKDLAAMLASPNCAMKGFVINPFTENIICGPQQSEVIARYINQKRFNNGELTVINEVTGVPETVTKPIIKYFDERKDVKKAYIMNMRKVNQLNRLIIVDYEGEDDKFNDFASDFTDKVLKDINDEKAPFMVMNFNQPAAKQATKEKVPFYVKVG